MLTSLLNGHCNTNAAVA